MTRRQQELLTIARAGSTILGDPKPAGFIWAISHKYREPWQLDLLKDLCALEVEGKLRRDRVIGWRDSPGHHCVVVFRTPKAKGDYRPYETGRWYETPPRLCA